MFLLPKKKSLRYILEYSWSDKMPYEKGFIVFSPHPLYPTAFHLFLFWLEALCLALLFLMLVFPVWGFRPTAEGIKKVGRIKTHWIIGWRIWMKKKFHYHHLRSWASFFTSKGGRGREKVFKMDFLSFPLQFTVLGCSVHPILSDPERTWIWV